MTKMLHALHKKDKFIEIRRILKRRAMLIFGVSFLGFSSTTLILQKITPVYMARAQLIFNDVESSFIKTQESILSSNKIARIVINKLKLFDDPEFNAKMNKVNKASKFKVINPYDIKLLSLSSQIIAQEIEPIIARFRNNFVIKINSSPYVIDLEYRSYTPHQAAVILNEIINSYLVGVIPEAKSNDNKYGAEILGRLDNNVAQVQNNIALLHKQIDEFKPDNKYVKVNDIYEQAKVKFSKAQAKVAPFLDGNGKIILTNKQSKSLTSPVMQKLKLRYSAVMQKLNALSIDYGSKHPEIILLKSQSYDVKKQILHERRNIILRLKSNRDQASVQLKSLVPPENNDNHNDNSISYNIFMNKKLEMLQGQLIKANHIFNEYKIIYEKSLNKAQEVKLPVQVLSQVSVSDTPIFPNKIKFLSIGFFLSFLLGILLAIFSEKMRNNFLSARQLEEYLNIPCYALIPNAKKDKDRPLSNYVMDNPLSETAEAVKALRLVIKLCAYDENRESKVVAITSSLPDEGKTTLSAWLAQLAAKSGERVILIDADLRRPTIHKVFENKNTLSLVEYLSGNNKLDEVIDTSAPSGLHIIYGRSVPNSALDLVSSDKLDKLVQSLRTAYDLIIIDTPASMAVSDSRAIAKISDQLLYAISWNKTSCEIVHNGITQFTKFKKAQISTVLTNINLKKHVKMGYGETVNYYGSYK